MSLGEAVVDLTAIASNLRTVAATTGTELMAVVKADGSGRGAVAIADRRRARSGRGQRYEQGVRRDDSGGDLTCRYPGQASTRVSDGREPHRT